MGQGYYIIVDISNLVQMTNSITCSTFIGDRVNEENLEIIIKVNEGICFDSYIYIRRVMWKCNGFRYNDSNIIISL